MKTSMAIIIAILVASALALLFLGGPDREFTTTSDQAYRLYETGVTQLFAVKRDEAKDSFARAVTLDPDFAMAWAMRANAILIMDQDSATFYADVADSLCKTLPNDLERAKVQLVISGIKDGIYDGDSLMTYILAEQPDNLLASTARANQLFYRRDESAAEAYHHVLEIEPNHAGAYNMLGYLEANRGNYAAALENLRKYAFMAPDLANPHDSLGEVLTWLGRYEEAVDEFKSALDIQGDFFYSLVHLGEVYMYRGQVTKGLEIMEGVRSQIGGSKILERGIDEFLIQIYFNYDMFDQGLEAIDQYAERNPDHAVTSYFQAIAALVRGDEARSEEYAAVFRERMTELGADNRRIQEQTLRLEHQIAAIDAMLREDWNTAITEWDEVLAHFKTAAPHETWGVICHQGEAYLASGRPRDAMDRALSILEINPRRIKPLLLLAEAALEADAPDFVRKALHQLDEIMSEADPGLPFQNRYREVKDRMAARAS